MDLAVPLVFASIFIFASISLFLVYKFGIKKKSYEEALAEHRKQANALLAGKPKPKEKKNKKAAKKQQKEKSAVSTNPEQESQDDTESVDSKEVTEVTDNVDKVKLAQQGKSGNHKGGAKTSPKQANVHVEFKEEPEEVTVEVPVEKEIKEVMNKKADHDHPKEEKKPEKSSKKTKQNKQETPFQLVDKIVVEPQPIEKEKPKEEKVVENIVVASTQEAVVNTGKEKKKKKSDFNAKQQITAERDQLMHMVRNAELSRNEVQLLIDVLLNKHLEAPAVIDEWSEGKSDPVQKLKKQLSEKDKLLADKEEEMEGLHAKLKEIRGEQQSEKAQFQQKLRMLEESKQELVAERTRLQQKCQELEDIRNKEIANFQRLLDDNKALHMQRGQLEAHYQETEGLIHTLKTDNAHLNNELQRLTQELQDQGANCAFQIQSLQEELRSKNEIMINMERGHGYALSKQIEETQGLSEQLQRLADNASKEEQRLLGLIEQLKSENEKLQEERNLQVNGSSDENKAHEVELLNLTNELTSVKSVLSAVNREFKDAEKRYLSELESTNDKCSRLTSELEEQKNKNNELRKKNWKVMEALNAAESRNKPTANKSVDIDIDQITSEVKLAEHNAQKEFLQRLFPEVESLKSVSTDDWQAEFGRLIRQHVSQLEEKTTLTAPTAGPEQNVDIARLQADIQRYKLVIDDTEGMLKKLQSNIELEERKWRNQLAQKDAEIQELKNKSISKLQIKVTSLESQLVQEQAEKQKLLEERESLQVSNRPEPKTVHADSTATIERLSEEVNRLREQLRTEQTKNGDAAVYQNDQIPNAINGQKYVEGETS